MEPEPQDQDSREENDTTKDTGNVLASAIAGNKKRLAKILESNDFYDSYLTKDQDSNDNQVLTAAVLKTASGASDTMASSEKNAKLLSVSEQSQGIGGSYNDILNVLQKLEAETNEDLEDNDSGRPQSASRSHSSASTKNSSPKRTPLSRAASRAAGTSKLR